MELMRVEIIREGRVEARGRRGGRITEDEGVGEAVGGRESRERIDIRRKGVRIVGTSRVARSLWRGLAVKFDISAAALSVDTFRYVGESKWEKKKEQKGRRTARVCTIARERGLDTLITGLFRSRRTGSRSSAFTTVCGRSNERFFVGVAFVNVAGEEVAGVICHETYLPE